MGNLAPLIRLSAAIEDLAAGRQSDLFVPIIKKPGHPGKGVVHANVQGLAARALAELVDSGEPVKQAADRVAKALRKGRRKDMKNVIGETVKNWRARLDGGPGAGAPDYALQRYKAPVDMPGSTSKERGEKLLKMLREHGEIFG